MASTELLAAKVVILEEEPNIPSITALPSAVLLAIGLAERGPIADRTLATSFGEATKIFGGFTIWGDLMLALYGFFYQGGAFAWISRTCHFTDLTDPTSYTATKGSRMLFTAGSAPSPARVVGVVSSPFMGLAHGDTITAQVDVLPPASTSISAKAASIDSGAGPWDLSLLLPGTLSFRVNGGLEQVVPITAADFANPAVATEAELAFALQARLTAVSSTGGGGFTRVLTDRKGTGASVECTGGTLNPTILFPAGVVSGTGNVFDVDAGVTNAEIKAIVEDIVTGIPGVTWDGTPTGPGTMETVSTGAAAFLQLAAAGLEAKLGLDTLPHSGADATPEATLLLEGKTPGAYANELTGIVEAATNGTAAYFNLKIARDGVVKETFPNVTMDSTSADYVQTRVNHLTFGSDLVAAIDQGLPHTPLLNRPINGTSAAFSGGGDGLIGLADSDFLGNEAGPTGLYCFDLVNSGRILIVPGMATSGIHHGMLDYAEIRRNGSMFCVLDCPRGLTAVGVKAYVDTTAALLEYSEFGAIYWPWIAITNPQPSVFGDVDTIVVAPSGWVAGKYAANDQKIGGIYESPAGIGANYGVMRGVQGVEPDPSGNTIHEVEDERKRDLVYPCRINPITRLPGTPWHIDGGRTLKSSGSFPNIGERRGVIGIEAAIKAGLVVMKHRYNNRENRQKAARIIKQYLIGEMRKGAFRSNDPATAFFVDASDALNPTSAEFAGVMTIRVGLATNKPGEYIVILVTQDTRSLEAELSAA